MSEKINWTSRQEKVITERNRNLLVSAAAGSGKTAVLIERIKRIIIEEKTDVDELLVVTFSNAAAMEMKEKLSKAISKELEHDDENSDFLRRQLELLPDASVSTFHKFEMGIIRDYSYLTDIQPGFVIGDEGDLQLIKRDVIDELFEEKYEEQDEGFLKLLDSCSTDRNDKSLKENILESYNKIMNIPDPFIWLDDNTELIKNCRNEKNSEKLKTAVCESIIKKTGNIYQVFSEAVSLADEYGVKNVADKLLINEERAARIFEAACEKNYEKVKKEIDLFEPPRIAAKKDEKEAWSLIKDTVKALNDWGKNQIKAVRSSYFTYSFDEYLADVEDTGILAIEFNELIRKFHKAYKAEKSSRNIIEFNDIEQNAIQILKNDDVCEEYRQRYKYIFVDEYQDTNLLQETLLRRIQQKDNLFMVGDVKQAIYKFRLAEPENFKRKYEAFRNDDSGVNMKIDLNSNFRSKGPVINAVNGIFRNVMDGYDDDASLKKGDAYEGEHQPPVELYLIDKSKDDNLSDEIQELKDAELEAINACRKIKEALNEKFHDSQANADRYYDYRDIVILTNSVKGVADIYAKVFREQGIPLYFDTSSGYFDTIEVEVFLNCLKIIDNELQDIPLVSVMKSAIGRFSIDELVEIRLYKKHGAFFKTFAEYCDSGANEELRDKCKAFRDMIARYREMAIGIPLEQLIWRILNETGYYIYVGSMPDGRQRQANIRALIDKASAFRERTGGEIFEFLSYIDAINKKVDVGQFKLLGEHDNVVRLMTIHKSKGLEFPMVILTGLGKKIVFRSKRKKDISLHKNIGIGFPEVDIENMWFRTTLMQKLISDKETLEELEERIRVLYVAMTRAKDKLILSGAVNDAKGYSPLGKAFASSIYADMIYPFADDGEIKTSVFSRQDAETEIELSDEQITEAEDFIGPDVIKKYREKIGSDDSEKKNYNEVARRLNYVYPFEKDCLKKSKYSVTELNKMARDDKTEAGKESDVSAGSGSARQNNYSESAVILKEPAFMIDRREISAAEAGTLLHEVMDSSDIKAAVEADEKGEGREYALQVIEKLKADEKISEKQAAQIDADLAAGFFSTDIARRMADSDNVFKEEEFNILCDIDGVDVMVQGIIDCFFEEDGEYVLIDYKSNYLNVRRLEDSLEKIKETYSAQISLYTDAIERTTGKKVKESYLYLFKGGILLPMNGE